MPKIILIDNYDSFTYNLTHLVKELGAEVEVLRNDQFDLEALEAYDKIILSPGPGIPEEAGLLLDVIRTYASRKSILGVCLGEQAIGQAFGATLHNLSDVFHGVQTEVLINDRLQMKSNECLPHIGIASDYIFDGLPSSFSVGRYHSWVVHTQHLPECLEVTAISNEGLIMALKHRTFDVHGIQFHPESILTPTGKEIVSNWLKGK